jgi:hypothetical protein
MAAEVNPRADQRVGTARRNAGEPGQHVPHDGACERAEHHAGVDSACIHDAGAESIGDVEAEHQEGHEIEESRPEHRVSGLQHTRRDYRGDGICSIVQPVEKVEQQGDCDEGDQDRCCERC